MLLATLVALCPGCAARTGMTVRGRGALAATPDGPSVVLRVVSTTDTTSKSGHAIWGVVDTPNPDSRFAELLAHAAAQEGGMNVIHPFRASERLQAAGLEPTLRPTDQELAQHVQALDCSSYLTADIRSWRHSYVFFSSSAIVEFDVACRVPGRPDPVWQVEVCNERRGMTDRGVALQALRGAFQALKRPHSGEGWCECSD